MERSGEKGETVHEWNDVVKPKYAGGLGINHLTLKSWDLLGKWWWWLWDKKDALRRKIFVSKYGEDEWSWVPGEVPKYRVLGLWRVISSFGDESIVRGVVFHEGMVFEVGDGSGVRSDMMIGWEMVICVIGFIGYAHIHHGYGRDMPRIWKGEGFYT